MSRLNNKLTTVASTSDNNLCKHSETYPSTISVALKILLQPQLPPLNFSHPQQKKNLVISPDRPRISRHTYSPNNSHRRRQGRPVTLLMLLLTHRCLFSRPYRVSSRTLQHQLGRLNVAAGGCDICPIDATAVRGWKNIIFFPVRTQFSPRQKHFRAWTTRLFYESRPKRIRVLASFLFVVLADLMRAFRCACLATMPQ
jgi:hypothetical protein